MARFRNISGAEQPVSYGLPRHPVSGVRPVEVLVADGGEFDVEDHAAGNYAVQPDLWEPIDEVAQAAVTELDVKPAKTAKTTKKST